ncbi:hypothetical protein AB0O52_20245 [Arthrobacter sp. NPDC080073]|uniref:hypothetical protein n=1 Tax=Arthrobacter sp. NPDC080073 TaxID=3155919 RepID=UPI003418AEE6
MQIPNRTPPTKDPASNPQPARSGRMATWIPYIPAAHRMAMMAATVHHDRFENQSRKLCIRKPPLLMCRLAEPMLPS